MQKLYRDVPDLISTIFLFLFYYIFILQNVDKMRNEYHLSA